MRLSEAHRQAPYLNKPQEIARYLRPSGRASSDLEAHKVEDSKGLGALAPWSATSEAAICTLEIQKRTGYRLQS